MAVRTATNRPPVDAGDADDAYDDDHLDTLLLLPTAAVPW